MKYRKIVKGIFLSRPNRFIANVSIDGKIEVVHVKNTGRCKELLINGSLVYLSESSNPDRKTKYDLIAVEKKRKGAETLLINMDSQIPNDAVAEWLPKSDLFSSKALIKREKTFGDSRFDFFVQDGTRKAFIEVKGVTLEQNGIAMFPDAPTERGVKHLKKLCKALDCGYETYVVFVIQMKGITEFRPNAKTHLEFAKTLKYASNYGVKVIAVDSIVTPNSIVVDEKVKVNL